MMKSNKFVIADEGVIRSIAGNNQDLLKAGGFGRLS